MTTEETAPTTADAVAQAAEYEKLWNDVRTQESFDTWQRLVEFTLKLDDISKVRETLVEFLNKYPLCFGYWHQYASAESKQSDQNPEKAKEVYEQGLSATPYSIELWLYYVEWLKQQKGTKPDDVRGLFGRALQYIGTDWCAHKVFDKWIEYEHTHGSTIQLAYVHTQAIATSCEDSKRLNTSFLEFVAQHDVRSLLNEDDISAMTVKAKKAKKSAEKAAAAAAADGSAGDTEMQDASAPGEDEAPPGDPGAPSELSAAELDAITVTDDDIKAAWLKEHADTFNQTLRNWERVHPYESRIRRRWWHQNPLQAPQLVAWWQYLDDIATDNDETALYAVFERCLVPCASYPEFWCRYFGFLHSAKVLQSSQVILDYAIQRATRVFCRPRAEVFLCAAIVLECRALSTPSEEEKVAALDTVRTTLYTAATEVSPRALDVVSRYANFERRSGQVEAARAVFKSLLYEACTNRDPSAVGDLATASVSLEDAIVHADTTVSGICHDTQAMATDDLPPGASEKQDGKENAVSNGSVGGQVSAPVTGTQQDSSKSAGGPTTDGMLEVALSTFPEKEALWEAAVAEKEQLLPWGRKRAQAVLDLYKRALSAKPAAKETDATEAAGSDAPKLALPLKAREKLASAAVTAMDTYGTPDLIWDAYQLVLVLLGEILQANASSGAKRPAQVATGGAVQPAVQQHIHAGMHAGHVDPNAMAMYGQDPNAAAAAAAAAQQHHQYYQYDYSQYYQQAAGYQHQAHSDYAAYYQQYGYQHAQ